MDIANTLAADLEAPLPLATRPGQPVDYEECLSCQ